METQEKKSVSQQKQDNNPLAISFALELGYSIAIPLVVLALGGRFLDKKLGTSPFLFLSAVVLSVFLSSFIVYKKSKQAIGSFEKPATPKKTEDKEDVKSEEVAESKEDKASTEVKVNREAREDSLGCRQGESPLGKRESPKEESGLGQIDDAKDNKVNKASEAN
jgi:F0F1-type ATP synthase assembly protein I